MSLTIAPSDEFEWRWTHCAFHEAGHAVVFAVHDLPTEGAHLFHHGRDPLSVHGHVQFDPQAAEHDLTGTVLAGFAGPAAEAIWLYRTSELGHRAARVYADRAACDGDFRRVRPYLHRSDLSHGQAHRRARELVIARWPAIGRVARALTRHAHLSDTDIHRLTH